MAETFPYEELDGARFQRLAQCLIVRYYDNVQCLPLSGADGGRDAIQLISDGERLKDAVIFQAKFKEREPLVSDFGGHLYRWLKKQLGKELPKLKKLKDNGASQYIIITNITGTGPLESGTRDKAAAWAADNLPLPTIFWWRDDIDTRLASNTDLVFRFNLFTGPDSVRAIIESRYNEHADGSIRTNENPKSVRAFMAYVVNQYEDDAMLRFEQADIESSPLLDLFVDVPITVPPGHSITQELARSVREARVSADIGRDLYLHVDYFEDNQYSDLISELSLDDGSSDRPRRNLGGAADLLLSTDEPTLRRVVIEAAPGQGKSTLAQYICQIHRVRVLGKRDDLQKVPIHHQEVPLRVPIRVEFKYLALWFAGKNPWTLKPVSDYPDYAASLESFIAADIRYSTGGMSCTVDDVVSILSRNPTFLCLDGLDEVPDIDMRNTVVGSIERSLSRLTELGADIQVLVTSRPAVFVKAPQFTSGFTYLQLAALDEKLIYEYAECWLAIRRMRPDQLSDFRDVLAAGLERNHVAELARNPMQLTILLSLILTKGRSLPDQRTELYEHYLTAYLDREAKKHEVVRENWRLLKRLHGYLAWILHGRSENDDGYGGEISYDELRDLIEQFLVEQERPELVDHLIIGTERFYLLVSRIQGTYEFEVQPIREFFAARYLYKTANRSTAASPAPGSRPEILAELLRNPYWFNVVRFYCGWYDEGELADLTRHLTDLCSDGDYRYLTHPRSVVSAILQDCTTAESPRDTRELVTLMSDDLGIRLVTALTAEATLPYGCGREMLVTRLRKSYLRKNVAEQHNRIANLLSHNDAPESLGDWWLGLEGSEAITRTEWLRLGSQSRAISTLSLEDALRIFSPDTTDRLDWIRCVEAGRFDVAFHDDGRLNRFVAALGDGYASITEQRRLEAGPLWLLPELLKPGRFVAARNGDSLLPMFIESPPPVLDGCSESSARSLLDLLNVAALARSDSADDLARVMRPIIDKGVEVLGQCWAVWRLALIAATSPRLSARRSISFGDETVSPLDRARRARLAGADVDFWSDVVTKAKGNREERLAACTSFFSWAHPDVFSVVLPKLAEWWHDLMSYDLRQIVDTIEFVTSVSGVGRSAPRPISLAALASLPDIPASMFSVLYSRTTDDADDLLLKRVRSAYDQDPAAALRSQHGSVVSELLVYDAMRRRPIEASLDDVAIFYSHITEPTILSRCFRHLGLDPFASYRSERSLDLARKILASPCDYPLSLIVQAQSRLASYSARQIPPLSRVASNAHWFDSS
jgi:hypothetical protein